MPIYVYVCSACGQRTELLHGINDPTPNFCPECGAEATLRKGIAAPAVVFKGSGWAKKDRRATSSSGSKDRDARDGATDSKPAESKPADTGKTEAAASGSGPSSDKPAAKASEGA